MLSEGLICVGHVARVQIAVLALGVERKQFAMQVLERISVHSGQLFQDGPSWWEESNHQKRLSEHIRIH